MGSIWRFKRRRTKWIWVWRWSMNLLKINCKNVAQPQPWFFQNKNGQKRDIRIFATIHATVPKSAKVFFLKQETPKKGHPCVQRPPKTAPKTAKAFFWKQETPFWGLLHAVSALFWIMVTFLQKYFQLFKTIYALAKLAPKKFRNLPSDARFCAKRFRHIDFWTFFLSISWKFYRVLQSKNKK